MAYGKSDFIDFEDIDLDVLLEEYTCSEVDSDDESCVVKSKSDKTSDKSKIYECDNCDKSYATISGLRGHLRTKHGVSNVKASDYRRCTSQEPQQKSYTFDEDKFDTFFTDSMAESIHIMSSHTVMSSRRAKIVETAKNVLGNGGVMTALNATLKPKFLSVLNETAKSKQSTNETMYCEFYKMTNNQHLINKIQDMIGLKSDLGRPFAGVLLHNVIKTLVKRKALLVETNKGINKPLNDNEQQILFYISGYMVHKLGMQRKNCKSDKVRELHEAIQMCKKNENDSEKSFVSQHATWTDKCDRGGLKTASDNFFLLVREFEICVREEISNTSITKDSFNRVILTEKILDRFMVKHYADKLFGGKYSSFVLESCIKLFLTVRGHAWARQQREISSDCILNSNALRKSLKDYYNKDK